MAAPRTSDLIAAAREALAANGFVPEFPPEVRREVRGLEERPPERDHGARDMRERLWSSIDNRESRDLDQVELAEALPTGDIRLFLGIADVDVHVTRGSAIDAHAAWNTTSVYTGVAVFPMLPERLSTDLTSLNEGEDRFAIVVEMDVGGDGAVHRHDAYRALVRNRAKLTYDSVGAWLEGRSPVPAAVSRIPGLEGQVRLQHEAAGRLRRFGRRAGALSVDSIEARPVTANGRVIDLQVTARDAARDLIESLMVAANSAMARVLEERGLSAIRRVVRKPRRWNRIVELAAEVGDRLPDEPDSAALGAFLERRREADPEHFADLSLLIVKLLGPGEYILERRRGARRKEGHFGLAVADYVHSTAPNRRFPDLVIQRLMKHGGSGAPPPYADHELAEIARRCTAQEDAARKVERLMRKRAAAALLAERVGQSFVATVTGASRKGTYVRLLSPPAEGRVVRGHTGLDVGDTTRVTLVAVDVDAGHIDFARETKDARRKLERMRRKKAAAAALHPRIGETFDAEVTGVSSSGTWVRLRGAAGEGRVVRGHKALSIGMRVPVRLIAADTVHGFIDFEYEPGIEPRKAERRRRKQAAALALASRIGERFSAAVTGITEKATWVRIDDPPAEGRLVRGTGGLAVGQRVDVVLLVADPARGYIDFAADA